MKKIIFSISLIFCMLKAADIRQLAHEVLVKGMNYYQYLGIPENATTKQIEEAVKEKVKKTHLQMIAMEKVNKGKLKSKRTPHSPEVSMREYLKDALIHEDELLEKISKTLTNKQYRMQYDLNLKLYRANKKRRDTRLKNGGRAGSPSTKTQ